MTRFLAFFLALLLIPAAAHAELRVDVTKGTMDPIPIAITNFVAADAGGVQFATDIPQVITADLVSTGLFRAIDPRAFIQDFSVDAAADPLPGMESDQRSSLGNRKNHPRCRWSHPG